MTEVNFISSKSMTGPFYEDVERVVHGMANAIVKAAELIEEKYEDDKSLVNQAHVQAIGLTVSVALVSCIVSALGIPKDIVMKALDDYKSNIFGEPPTKSIN